MTPYPKIYSPITPDTIKFLSHLVFREERQYLSSNLISQISQQSAYVHFVTEIKLSQPIAGLLSVDSARLLRSGGVEDV